MRDKHWLDRCERSDDGTPSGSLNNALLALRNAPWLAGAFVLAGTRPREPFVNWVSNGEPVTDGDIHRIFMWMKQNGLPRVGLTTIRHAVVVCAIDESLEEAHDVWHL